MPWKEYYNRCNSDNWVTQKKNTVSHIEDCNQRLFYTTIYDWSILFCGVAYSLITFRLHCMTLAGLFHYCKRLRHTWDKIDLLLTHDCASHGIVTSKRYRFDVCVSVGEPFALTTVNGHAKGGCNIFASGMGNATPTSKTVNQMLCKGTTKALRVSFSSFCDTDNV